MRVASIEFFAWEPRHNRITLSSYLTIEQRHFALTLALAHRALGHWGNDRHQRSEAHALADYWYGSTEWRGLPELIAA